MKKMSAVRVALAAGILTAALAGCGDDGAEEPIDFSAGQAAAGEVIYSARCAACHGADGYGTAVGPPLVHEIYRPGHHSDIAFQLAIRTGVRPHHWGFGAMPAIPGLSNKDIADIVAYVRMLQEDAGI